MMWIFPQFAAGLRVACLGNSLTKGVGGNQSYPAQLATMVPATIEVLPTFGSSGKTATRVDGRYYLDTRQYADAVAAGFDVAIVLLGTNDAQVDLWRNDTFFIDSYVELLLTIGQKDVIFVGTPPAYLGGDSRWGNTTLINERFPNELIPAVVAGARNANLSVGTIDFYGAVNADPDFYGDAIHLNDQGYRLMAEAARDALLTWLAGPDEWFKRGEPAKDCDWVAAYPSDSTGDFRRCRAKGHDDRFAWEACASCGSNGTDDSTSWFKKDDPAKDCQWVALYPYDATDFTSRRCRVRGDDETFASEACVTTCADVLADSPSWFKLGNPSKNCDWVAALVPNRCFVKGEAGVLASEACAETCLAYSS